MFQSAARSARRHRESSASQAQAPVRAVSTAIAVAKEHVGGITFCRACEITGATSANATTSGLREDSKMPDELRMVIYVYSRTTVFIGSGNKIGMLEMTPSYANATYGSFANNADNLLEEGVYGIIANAPVELRVPAGAADKVIVRSDTMRKDPWPTPPPPPPAKFGAPGDWPRHLGIFMVPLGGSFENPRLHARWADGLETLL